MFTGKHRAENISFHNPCEDGAVGMRGGRNVSSRDHTGGLDHQSSLELASKPVLSYVFPNMKLAFEDLRSPCHPKQELELRELASSEGENRMGRKSNARERALLALSGLILGPLLSRSSEDGSSIQMG